ncbi:DUF1491 family protein, partial [Klebsiella pneumoniae]|nr:DUF1491 family protein [Klebsiella pneumoniae]
RRLVDRDGGFAAIVRRGDAEAGDIMIVLHERGEPAALLSRAIGGDGWARESLPPESLAARLERARARDPDLWILELDVADA